MEAVVLIPEKKNREGRAENIYINNGERERERDHRREESVNRAEIRCFPDLRGRAVPEGQPKHTIMLGPVP